MSESLSRKLEIGDYFVLAYDKFDIIVKVGDLEDNTLRITVLEQDRLVAAMDMYPSNFPPSAITPVGTGIHVGVHGPGTTLFDGRPRRS